MAIIIRDGQSVDPKKAPEGTRWDPERGPAFGFAHQEGEDIQVGIGTGDRVEVRGGKWTVVGRERER